MGREKLFEEEIKKFLRSKGIYKLGTSKQNMKVEPIGYYEKRFANAYTGSGLPDMHIVIHNQSIEVEIKAEKGKPSELQKVMIKQIINSNCLGIVLYPKDFELFKKVIEQLINKELINGNELISSFSWKGWKT